MPADPSQTPPPPIQPASNADYFARDRKRRLNPLRRFQKSLDAWLWRLVEVAYAPAARRLSRGNRRFLGATNTTRIGHLAAEPDWYLKKTALGDLPERPVSLLVRRTRAANPCLLDLWGGKVDLVSGGLRYRLMKPFLRFPELVIDTGEGIIAIDGAADYARVLARWGDRPPLLEIPPDMAARCRDRLLDAGLPEHAWFAGIHAREGGYSPKDEHVHRHRNSDIGSFRLAVAEIRRRGGWAIRMGDTTMQHVDDCEGMLDYAHSELKSPEMDIYLCAGARLFLGNTSGLCMVATAFGVPCVLVNMIPHGAGLGLSPHDISIPKLLRRDGRLLSFPEIFRSEIANFRAADLYDQSGLEIVDNTSEEIRDATSQMLDRLDGVDGGDTDADALLQHRWRSLFTPEHYSFHAGGCAGRQFLRDHAALLQEP